MRSRPWIAKYRRNVRYLRYLGNFKKRSSAFHNFQMRSNAIQKKSTAVLRSRYICDKFPFPFPFPFPKFPVFIWLFLPYIFGDVNVPTVTDGHTRTGIYFQFWWTLVFRFEFTWHQIFFTFFASAFPLFKKSKTLISLKPCHNYIFRRHTTVNRHTQNSSLVTRWHTHIRKRNW